MTSLSIRALKEQLSGAKERAKAMLAVGIESGLVWELRPDGVRAAAEAFLGGALSPATIYRVHGANTPDKIALYWRDTRRTFADVDASMDRIASGLSRRGFGRGKSLVLMTRNRPEFIEAHGAAARIGAPAVSISWRSTASELAYLATHCGARGIVFEPDFFPVVEEALKSLPAIERANLFALDGGAPGCTSFDVLRDEPAGFRAAKGTTDGAAVVIYTSGTTGKPKGAVRKFPKDSLASWMKFIAETPMRHDDIHLAVCPLYHSTGFGFLGLAHVLGQSAVLLDEFKPEAFLQNVSRFSVTSTAVVPTMLHRVLSLGPEVLERYDTRSLRVIFTGGAPLPGPLALDVMDHFGDVLFNFYGATETGLVTLAKPKDLRAAPWSIGRPIPGNEIRLLGDDGREVNAGEVGELYVKNKLLVSGYHKDEGATQASMKEGYFSVGDLARVDRDGRYFIEGRKRDMIISGGVNVYPAEVESVFESHPAVAEVAVVGVPDREWGERVRAFIVKRAGAVSDGVDEGALKAWAREKMAGPKVPREFVFLEALPRNPTGKVLKRELRAWTAPVA